MSETKLKISVLKYLKSLPYVWVYKANDKFTSGIPDILICFYGTFVAIELKFENNKVTKLQSYVLWRIRNAGGKVLVARSLKEAKQASSTAKYDGIGYVTIEKPKLHASCNKENREQLVLYLRGMGHGDMVIETVGNKSLNMVVKECIDNGLEIPEYINHYFERVVKLYE